MRKLLLLTAATLLAACNPTTPVVGGAPAPASSAAPIAEAPAVGAPASGSPTADAPAVAASEVALAPMTEEQKTIYALGASAGRQIRVFDLSPEELDIYAAGVKAGVQGGQLLIDTDAYGSQIQQLARARMAGASAAFLDRAAQEEGAVKTASGFVYKSLVEGTGVSPQRSDTVSVNYRAMTIDDHEVDSSPPSQLASFRLGDVIPCWTEGVQMMKTGGKARLVCPPALAYGDRGAPPRIPPATTLVFEIELVSIKQ